jgi:hypothetical protein
MLWQLGNSGDDSDMPIQQAAILPGFKPTPQLAAGLGTVSF